jgi:hypothetical protein
MSTIKISQLPVVTTFSSNTQNTIFVGVDLDSDLTGQFTAQAIAKNLFLNNTLIVGNNNVQFANVVGQFSGSNPTYLQINNQNFSANGSADYVASTSDSDNTFGFIDMGIEGSNYNGVVTGYPAFKPYDGYLYMVGKTLNSPTGNLIIGTQNAGNTVFINGGVTNQNIVALMTANGLVLNTQSYLTFADGTRQTTAANPAAYSSAIGTTANNASANTVLLQAGLNAANANLVLAFASIAAANANLAILQSVNNTQNTNIQSATTLALYALGVQTTQNSWIQSAWNQANVAGIVANTTATVANSALQNTTNILTAGNLSVNGNIIAIGIQSTAGAITTGNLIVNGTTTLNGTANISGIVNMNAQVILTNTSFSNTQSALTITATPTVALPSQDGYMIHISGKQNVASRIITDSYGANTYVVYAGRSARGNVSNPSAVQTGDVLSRFSGNGYGTTKFQPLGTARIDFIAAENYTDTATGSQIKFYNCTVGTNTITNIATFNGDSVTFTGVVNPQKGLVLSPNVVSGITNTLNIDIANNSLYKVTIDNTSTINLSGYQAGKIVEVWMTNSSGLSRTVTHGCTALNSTVNSTTFTIPGTSSAYLKYFSIDSDQANTFCQISYS